MRQNLERTLEAGAITGTAAVGENLKAALSTIPCVKKNFYTGSKLYRGELV